MWRTSRWRCSHSRQLEQAAKVYASYFPKGHVPPTSDVPRAGSGRRRSLGGNRCQAVMPQDSPAPRDMSSTRRRAWWPRPTLQLRSTAAGRGRTVNIGVLRFRRSRETACRRPRRSTIAFSFVARGRSHLPATWSRPRVPDPVRRHLRGNQHRAGEGSQSIRCPGQHVARVGWHSRLRERISRSMRSRSSGPMRRNRLRCSHYRSPLRRRRQPREVNDVVVVGAGAAGGAAAYVRPRSSAQGIDARGGSMIDPQRACRLDDWPCVERPSASPQVQRPVEDRPMPLISSTPIRVMIRYAEAPGMPFTGPDYVGLGGRTLTWGCALQRLGPLDFKTQSRQGSCAPTPADRLLGPRPLL